MKTIRERHLSLTEFDGVVYKKKMTVVGLGSEVT